MGVWRRQGVRLRHTDSYAEACSVFTNQFRLLNVVSLVYVTGTCRHNPLFIMRQSWPARRHLLNDGALPESDLDVVVVRRFGVRESDLGQVINMPLIRITSALPLIGPGSHSQMQRAWLHAGLLRLLCWTKAQGGQKSQHRHS